jgi:hypothetical protein
MTALAVPPPGPEPLDRHQLRRSQSIPTITLLAGPTGLCVRRWRAWAAHGGRTVAMPEEPDPCAAVSAWIAVLAASRDLVGDAITWLAAITPWEADELRSRFSAMTRQDFDRFWKAVPLDATRDRLAATCRGLLACHVVREPLSATGLFEQLAAVLTAEPDGLWPAVLAGVGGLIPAPALPGILYVPPAPSEDPVRWLSTAARTLAGLAVAAPAVPMALAAPADLVAAFVRASPDSRITALLREGLVTVEGLSERDLTARLQSAGASAPEETIRRVVTEGIADEMAVSLAEAARRSGRPETAQQEEEARSAAELFLFDLLESLPTTAGLFSLNTTLSVRPGHVPGRS